MFYLFIESLPLIIVLSAVVGGIILTVASIVIMILCRRTTSMSLKSLKNRNSGVTFMHERENEYNGAKPVANTKSDAKTGSKLKRNKDNKSEIDGFCGNSPNLKSNGIGFDLGSNHPLISNDEGPQDLIGQQQRSRMIGQNWNGEDEETNVIDNQNFEQSNGEYHDFSEGQVILRTIKTYIVKIHRIASIF